MTRRSIPTRSASIPFAPRAVPPQSLPAHGHTATGPTGVLPLTEEEADILVRVLKALADPTRLRLLSLLHQHEGTLCVFELTACFPLEQPTISHHLRILRDAGLINCHKKGLWAYYYVCREALERAYSILARLQNG